ncbi:MULTISPECIES: hypothetical protein [unclassified Streptomyces]|uniref:hypothetical protein n=1 Tax=unclassified Streptomyces TaxID=2593676 RepID=UPI0013005A11|nr:hypothetical protein [Streptomyces sp. DH-12]
MRIREVVRDGVEFAVGEEYVTADELLILKALTEEPDDRRVLRGLRRRRTRGEPLGFGTGEIVGVLTAVLWLAVDEGVRSVTGQAVQTLSDRLRGRLRRLFRRPDPQPELPALTQEQLNAVAQVVSEQVTEAGLSPEQAQRLAERVAGRLALGTPAEVESGTREESGDPDDLVGDGQS